ncbi:MAG: hypothetical protein ACM3NH_01195 [Candidatus Saccharibacteria bacterium]
MKVALEIEASVREIFRTCLLGLGHEVVSRGEPADIVISDSKDWEALRRELSCGCRMVVQFIWHKRESDSPASVTNIAAQVVNLCLVNQTRRSSAIYDRLSELIPRPTVH